jgi:hypothetical protein
LAADEKKLVLPKYLNFATFSKDLLAACDFVSQTGEEKATYCYAMLILKVSALACSMFLKIQLHLRRFKCLECRSLISTPSYTRIRVTHSQWRSEWEADHSLYLVQNSMIHSSLPPFLPVSSWRGFWSMWIYKYHNIGHYPWSCLVFKIRTFRRPDSVSVLKWNLLRWA